MGWDNGRVTNSLTVESSDKIILNLILNKKMCAFEISIKFSFHSSGDIPFNL